MRLELRKATANDLQFLAQMNQQLIEDEGSSNPMNLGQLENRMEDWLFSDWNIDLICHESDFVGYSLYHFRELKEVYLRQYFIRREYRNRGFGQEGIRQLLNKRFKDIETITIDVLESNPGGMNFWRKVGFMPYCTMMKLKPDADKEI